MPRRARMVNKIKIKGDAVYNNVILHKFINKIMTKGKKSVAEKIVYTALDDASKKLKMTQLEVFLKAMNNVKPVMEVRPRRVGGATYQVPVEVREERSVSLALSWIRDHSRQRGGHSMVEKLSHELVDACNGAGGAYKKREETHKVAESNRAFAHFRW